MPAEWEQGADRVKVTRNDVYTEIERDMILETLNTASESELSRITFLRGKKSSSIVKYREEHGPFLELNSLVNVPHFQAKIMVKVFDAILNRMLRDERPRKIESKAISRLIKPGIAADRIQATQSIVSIVFGIQKIAWAHVNRQMTVTDWQQKDWYRFMKGNYHSHMYLEDISAAISNIPQADFYILEKPGIPIQNSNLFPVTLHLHMVEAMLYTLLNKQYAEDGEHRVLSMARSTVGKHFALMVGESRTSGVDIVKQFFMDTATQGQSWVTFSQEIIHRYRHQFHERRQKRNEELCDALLQAITFYDLVVT
ncbi:transcription elongation factor, mitochondrial [Pelodytes ibericus]